MEEQPGVCLMRGKWAGMQKSQCVDRGWTCRVYSVEPLDAVVLLADLSFGF